jgi:hypothetical protein
MCPLDDIVKWNQERRLNGFSATAEYSMLMEELQEFYAAYSEESRNGMVDALCDIMVVATGALYKLGYDPKTALEEAVKEISSRTGAFDEQEGKWKKDPNQDPTTLYKADYIIARR